MSVRRLKKTRALAPPERVRQNTSMPFFSWTDVRTKTEASESQQWSDDPATEQSLTRRHLHDASPLDAQRVLVDADGHLVLQDGAGLGANGAQVIGHVEGGGHDGPQRHLGARLFGAEAKVTDNQLKEEEEKEIFIHCAAQKSFQSFPTETMRSFCFCEAGKKKFEKCSGMIVATLEIQMEQEAVKELLSFLWVHHEGPSNFS